MKYEIYTKPDCSYCVESKKLLEMLKIEYKEVIVGQDITSESYRQLFPGHTTVPAIVVGGVFLGGFSDLLDSLVSEITS